MEFLRDEKRSISQVKNGMWHRAKEQGNLHQKRGVNEYGTQTATKREKA